MRSPNGLLRLVLLFLVLVFVPSLLLAVFTLRAVDSERRGRAARVRESHEAFAAFAARTLHHELTEEEIRWDALLARRAEEPVPTPEAIHAGYARRWLRVHGDGRIEDQGSATPVALPMLPFPTASDRVRWDAAQARADSFEYEVGDPSAAAAVYAALAIEIGTPRLRAVALAAHARNALRAGDARTALDAARTLRQEFEGLFDLDAEPLDLVGRWSEARALEALHDAGAAAAWRDLAAATTTHAAELTAAQHSFYTERATAGMARLGSATNPSAIAPAPPVSVASDVVLARKLERRLLHARLQGQHVSGRVQFLSDVFVGMPYLLAYRLLPPTPGSQEAPDSPAGIVGLVVDLPRLSNAVLPRFLGEIEPARWAVVDDAGRAVIGATPAAPTDLVQRNLDEPFEFWTVAVAAQPSAVTGTADARTRAWLASVAVLLFTILAGAWLVVRGLRRQARLAQLKTSFASNVSHELRTPLASIRMYAEMLEMGEGRSDATERRRQISVIRSEASRLERLIDAVLDFASLSRGTRRFTFEYEEIGALVEATAQSFRDQALAQGFTYTVEVEPDLPELRVDADALRQVILNLLANAVKYSEGERWIAVRAYRRNDRIGIEVEDRGIGIDPVEQRRIFEDFYRVDERLSAPRQGVGLGLTLVRRIVEAHGGRVEVQSARGQGARFIVWLVADSRTATTSPPSRSGPVAQGAGS